VQAFSDFFHVLLGLGLDPKDLTFGQMSLRAILVFLAGLVMVRMSSKRSLAEKTAFDAVLLVILASVLSRAINGSAGFSASIGASLVLVLLHRFFSWVACRSHLFGKLIKGSPAVIIQDGKVDERAMQRHLVSEHDLEEDLRLDAKLEDLSSVRVARIERSGDISFITK
jgi:uncharacterized membrane protein YcaP (DUF421 family)